MGISGSWHANPSAWSSFSLRFLSNKEAIYTHFTVIVRNYRWLMQAACAWLVAQCLTDIFSSHVLVHALGAYEGWVLLAQSNTFLHDSHNGKRNAFHVQLFDFLVKQHFHKAFLVHWSVGKGLQQSNYRKHLLRCAA